MQELDFTLTEQTDSTEHERENDTSSRTLQAIGKEENSIIKNATPKSAAGLPEIEVFEQEDLVQILNLARTKILMDSIASGAAKGAISLQPRGEEHDSSRFGTDHQDKPKTVPGLKPDGSPFYGPEPSQLPRQLEDPPSYTLPDRTPKSAEGKSREEQEKSDTITFPLPFDHISRQEQTEREPGLSTRDRIAAKAKAEEILANGNLDLFPKGVSHATPQEIAEINYFLSKSGSDLRLKPTFYENPYWGQSKTLSTIELIDLKKGQVVEKKNFLVPL